MAQRRAGAPVNEEQAEREAFDRFAAARGWSTLRGIAAKDRYLFAEVQTAWCAWKARAVLNGPDGAHPLAWGCKS